MLFSIAPAHAVDLANRLGMGYANQMSEDLPMMQVRYYPNSTVGMSLAIGVDTENQFSKFGALAKLYRVIFTEEHMNFYVAGGAGLLSVERAGVNQSGFELMGTIGGEFFFTGLDSLGFTFEAGVGVRSDSDGSRFRTIGDHPLKGGIIFYF